MPDSGSHSIHDRSPATWTVREPDAHARAVRAMFARIARVYDFMNHLLSLNFDRQWRRHLVARIDADAWEVLDACAGTGDLALACLRAGKGRLVLVSDFCPEMLARGRRKGLGGTGVARGGAGPGAGPGAGAGVGARADAVGAGSRAGDDTTGDMAPRAVILAADAQRLPLPDASVDAVVVAFGVRNLADVRAGIREMARVLRSRGQLLVLEFFRAKAGAEAAPGSAAVATGAATNAPARGAVAAVVDEERGPSRPVRAWLGATLPLLGRLFARDGSAYSYLPSSMDRFLTVGEFRAVLEECGLGEVSVERQTLGISHLVEARKAF